MKPPISQRRAKNNAKAFNTYFTANEPLYLNSIESKIEIKPLSVNCAWKGKRYKTEAYKQYETSLLWLLPEMRVPRPPFKLTLEFGFSNKASDFDNPTKPLVDILQKKYGFNDKDIYEAVIRKKIVPKGKEYVCFSLEHLNQ